MSGLQPFATQVSLTLTFSRAHVVTAHQDLRGSWRPAGLNLRLSADKLMRFQEETPCKHTSSESTACRYKLPTQKGWVVVLFFFCPQAFYS